MYNQNVELRHLRYFLTVAEELHFSRAAARLNMAQPPLSQQIKQLEQTIGVLLFQRDRHGVTLTDAGKVFRTEAQTIVANVDKAVKKAQMAQKGQFGEVRIGFPSPIAHRLLPRILQLYRERFPMVNITLHEYHSLSQIKLLQEGELDVGVIILPDRIPSSLESKVLMEEALLLAVPENHPYAQRQNIQTSDLIDEALIVPTYQHYTLLRERISNIYASAGFSPDIVQELSSIRVILIMVAAGLGLAIVPRSVQYLHHQGIVYVPLNHEHEILKSAVIWRKNEVSPIVHEFIEVVQHVVQSNSV